MHVIAAPVDRRQTIGSESAASWRCDSLSCVDSSTGKCIPPQSVTCGSCGPHPDDLRYDLERFDFECIVHRVVILRPLKSQTSLLGWLAGQREIVYVELGPVEDLNGQFTVQRTAPGRKTAPVGPTAWSSGTKEFSEEWLWTDAHGAPIQTDYRAVSARSTSASGRTVRGSTIRFTAMLSSDLKLRVVVSSSTPVNQDAPVGLLGEARLGMRNDILAAAQKGGAISVPIVQDSRVNGTAWLTVRPLDDVSISGGMLSQCRGSLSSPSGIEVMAGYSGFSGGRNEQWTRLQGHTGPVLCCAVFPDGDRVLTGSVDATAKIWSKSGMLLATLSGHRSGVVNCGVFPSGDKVITAAEDLVCIIWNCSGMRAMQEVSLNGIRIFAVFPSSDRILAAGLDENARIITASGHQLFQLRGHMQRISAVAVFPSGQHVLTVSLDRNGIIWNASGSNLAVLRHHTDCITCCAVFRSGAMVLTGSRDGSAVMWGANERGAGFGQGLHILRGHRAAVVCCAAFPSADRAVTGSDDASAIVWSTDGRQLAKLAGHTQPITSCSVFPGWSENILTCSRDMRAMTWTVTGQMLLDLRQHGASINSCAIFPAGDHIVTAADDGFGIIWSVSSTWGIASTLQAPGKLLNVFGFGAAAQNLPPNTSGLQSQQNQHRSSSPFSVLGLGGAAQNLPTNTSGLQSQQIQNRSSSPFSTSARSLATSFDSNPQRPQDRFHSPGSSSPMAPIAPLNSQNQQTRRGPPITMGWTPNAHRTQEVSMGAPSHDLQSPMDAPRYRAAHNSTRPNLQNGNLSSTPLAGSFHNQRSARSQDMPLDDGFDNVGSSALDDVDWEDFNVD